MPREISGQQPISKSQKNKWRKKSKPVQVHGGICSRCGQTSNSCIPGSVHESCGEALPLFMFHQRIRSAILLDHFDGNRGKWLSSEDYKRFQEDMILAKGLYLEDLRNFNTTTNRWENGYSQPIDFLTREVLPETPLKVSIQTQSVPVDKMEIVLDEEMEEQKAA